MIRNLAILSIVFCLACGDNEPAENSVTEAAGEAAAAAGEAVEAAGEAAEAAGEAAQAAGEAAQAAGEATAEAAGNAAEATGEAAEAAGEGLGEALGALGAALGAAGEPEGDTPCEQAYNGAMAMMQQMQAQLGEGEGPEGPNREQFLSACNELPEGAQQCAIISYAMQHAEECAQHREALQGLRQ